MSLLQIILLAVVQGLTEFLPVSSSGHLVVVNRLLESLGQPPVADLLEVSIVLHLGTLAAVLLYYRKEVMRLLGSDRRVIWLLVVGTIPAAVLGVWIKKGLPAETANLILNNVLLAGCMFPVTALGAALGDAVLGRDARPATGGATTSSSAGRRPWRSACCRRWHCCRAFRAAGRPSSAGWGWGSAARRLPPLPSCWPFPPLPGPARSRRSKSWRPGTSGTPLGTLAVGFVVSMLVGLGALALLIHWVRQGRLAMFAYYLFPTGTCGDRLAVAHLIRILVIPNQRATEHARERAKWRARPRPPASVRPILPA